MYQKQDFVDGQKLKAEHLWRMEDGIEESVAYTEQTLTDEQKTQARENIGAMAELGAVYFEAYEQANDPNTPILNVLSTENDTPVIIRSVADGVNVKDAVNVGQLNAAVGDIEAALDSIIAIQESLIGGDS